ncbi:MAG: AlbA family DNA-binding domain-containing protein [Aggregatilineales bacterium]
MLTIAFNISIIERTHSPNTLCMGTVDQIRNAMPFGITPAGATKMGLENKSLDTLTEADFQELITNAVSEGKKYDYKQQLPGGKDEDKREFLYDVSSFANTVGGHLIFGVDENQGLPTGFPGLPGIDADREKLRLEQLISSGIEPRISGINIVLVTLKNGPVLVIRIPRSWLAPHVVKLGGIFKFYARNSAGKYPLDVSELRMAFLATNSATVNARSFRVDRVAKIMSGETPVALLNSAKLMLHLNPPRHFWCSNKL